MAYGYKNRYDNSNGSTGVSLAMAGVVAALHDTIVVEFTYGNAARVTETVTDGTNTYDWLATVVDASNGQAKAVFVCKDAAAGTFTVTAGTGASSFSFRGISVTVFDGLDNSATAQVVSLNVVNAGTGTDAVSTGNVTPAGQPAMVYGGVIEVSGSAAVPSAGTGFTSRGTLTTWESVIGHSLTQDKRITSTSALPVTWTASNGTHSFLTVGLVILEAGGAAPAPTLGSRRLKTPVHPGAGPYNPLKFKRSRRNTFVVLSTIAGTLAKTNANDTLAASGVPTVSGSLARANAADTSAAAGAPTVSGSLAKANAPDTLTAAGSPTVTGSVAYTNAADTLAASGSVGSAVTGTVAYTNANDTLSAAGNVSITGSVAKANAADSLSASGSPVVSGSAAVTNANDTLVASGTVNGSVTGSVNYTNQPDTLAASGTVAITGSASVTNADDTLDSQAERPPNTSGGAVIVDLPKKKRKKSLKKQIEEIVEARPELTEEQVKGMEAVYGAQMRQAIGALPMEPLPEVVEQLVEAIIEPFEIPPSVFAEPEPVTHDTQKPVEPEEPENLEDEIALIMAIIEAIG